LPDGTYVCKPKIQIWVNFGGPWQWKMLEYFTVIWHSLVYKLVFGIFVVIWCIFCHFGILYQEKSGDRAPSRWKQK
jgi:hypothetical protein